MNLEHKDLVSKKHKACDAKAQRMQIHSLKPPTQCNSTHTHTCEAITCYFNTPQFIWYSLF